MSLSIFKRREKMMATQSWKRRQHCLGELKNDVIGWHNRMTSFWRVIIFDICGKLLKLKSKQAFWRYLSINTLVYRTFGSSSIFNFVKWRKWLSTEPRRETLDTKLAPRRLPIELTISETLLLNHLLNFISFFLLKRQILRQAFCK
jgi:hypothetical protein